MKNQSNSNKSKCLKVKKLSKYLLMEPAIGEGTFGKVYKCLIENNYEKLYACKSLNIDFYMSNPIFIQKLRQELKVTKSLNHPNLVNLIDLKRTKHNLYMILDFINGDNMEVFLEKYFTNFKKQPSMNLVKHISIELIAGLNYLGQNNIIHRDIKLENIMLDLDGKIFV
jgi:serine/threonine protein kinase